MIKAVNNSQIEFISKYDTETDKTIFILGTISTKQMSFINDMLSRWRVNAGKMEEIVIQTSQRNFEVVRQGLKGWKNFKDGNKDIQFSEKNIELIPYEVIDEIAERLLAINSLSQDEKKN